MELSSITGVSGGSLEHPADWTSNFLVRPRMQRHESLTGYWLRLTYQNGLERASLLSKEGMPSRLKRLRVCPLCLSERDHVWPTAWDDALWPICSIHHIWLVDQCSACGRYFMLQFIGYRQCKCGQEFSELPTAAIPRRMLALLPSPAHRDIAFRLGSLSAYGLEGKSLGAAAKRHITSLRVQMLIEGASILEDWPTAFETVLRRIQVPSENPAAIRSIGQAFPGLMKFVRGMTDGGLREKMRSAIINFAESTENSPNPIVGKINGSRRSTSLTALAREMNVSYKRMAAAIGMDGQLRSETGRRQARLHVISRDQIASIRARLFEFTWLADAARHTALPTSRLKALARAGILEQRGHSVAVQSLYGLDSSLRVARPLTAGLKSMRLATALRFWVAIDDTAVAFKAIIEGQVRLSRKSPQSRIGDLMVCVDDLRSNVTFAMPSLSVSEAGRILGLSSSTTYELIRAGLIVPLFCKLKNRNTMRIDNSCLTAFQTRYVKLSELCKAEGTRPKNVANWALQRGIEVVSGPSIDGVRQYIALRPKGAAM